MPNHNDPETLKIPAYMRKKALISQSKQKLILTALDRKEALTLKKKEAGQRKKTQRRTVSSPSRDGVINRHTTTRRPISSTPLHHSPPTAQPVPMPAAQPQLQENGALTSFTRAKKIPSIGTITHYLDGIGVAIIQLNAPLKNGAIILMENEDHLFPQRVEEMQIDRKPVKRAKKGTHIGLKTDHSAKVNSHVWLLQK